MANTTVHLDNLATPGMPVWRRRIRVPLTPWAVRCDLIAQAAEVPEAERAAYVSRRLTALDRALSDAEAQALEEWLLCHELLNGRTPIGSGYGDRNSSGPGRNGQIPDGMMKRVNRHASNLRHVPREHRCILDVLAALMMVRHWDFGDTGRALFGTELSHHQAKRRFIGAVKQAARYLLQLHDFV